MARPRLKWHTFGGGTGAAEGRHSYQALTPIGDYHIDPVTSRSGRHAGYMVRFANTKGALNVVGLWSFIGPGGVLQSLHRETPVTLPEAKRRCALHWAQGVTLKNPAKGARYLVLRPRGGSARDTAQQTALRKVVKEDDQFWYVEVAGVSGPLQFPKFAWEIAAEKTGGKYAAGRAATKKALGNPDQPLKPGTPTLGPCSCRPGVQRDNCPVCEGTGQRIDFAALRKALYPRATYRGGDVKGNPPTRGLAAYASYQGLDAFLGNKTHKKLAHNTYAERRDPSTIVVVLHRTPIVAFARDGMMTLNSGGYQTVTTKARMNQFLTPNGWHLTQKRGKWVVSVPEHWRPVHGVQSLDFFDGMTLPTVHHDSLDLPRRAALDNPRRQKLRSSGRRASVVGRIGRKIRTAPFAKYARHRGHTNPPTKGEGPGQNIRNAMQMVALANMAAAGIRTHRVNADVMALVKEIQDACADTQTRLSAALRQVEKGVRGNPHHNPLAIFGANPPRVKTVRDLGRVIEIRYKRNDDGKYYKHDFKARPRLLALSDGTIAVRP